MTTSIWEKEISQARRDKITDDHLLALARIAVSQDTSVLNDIEISSLLLRARRIGKDGRRYLCQALNEKYAEIPAIQETAGNFQCPNCKKEFKSQAALSGHGINRCKG